jgi:AcrR family transcriptional regulator
MTSPETTETLESVPAGTSAEAARLPRAQARGLETRGRIKEAAWWLFARDGYQGTSIGDVAARAGVGVGTVYHHFGDKRAMLLELLRNYEGLDIFREDGESPLEKVFSGPDVRSAIVAMALALIEIRIAHPSLMPAAGQLALRDPEVAAVCAEIGARRTRQMQRAVEASQKEGKIRPEIDSHAAAFLIHHLGQSMIWDLAGGESGLDVERSLSELADLWCSYLLVR